MGDLIIFLPNSKPNIELRLLNEYWPEKLKRWNEKGVFEIVEPKFKPIEKGVFEKKIPTKADVSLSLSGKIRRGTQGVPEYAK